MVVVVVLPAHLQLVCVFRGLSCFFCLGIAVMSVSACMLLSAICVFLNCV